MSGLRRCGVIGITTALEAEELKCLLSDHGQSHQLIRKVLVSVLIASIVFLVLFADADRVSDNDLTVLLGFIPPNRGTDCA